MKKSLMNLGSVLGLGTALVVGSIVAGCAKDRTTNDYHDEQEAKIVALYQSISGTYRGMIAHADGSNPGVIEINLYPQQGPINSSDNAGMQSQAYLTGTATF